MGIWQRVSSKYLYERPRTMISWQARERRLSDGEGEGEGGLAIVHGDKDCDEPLNRVRVRVRIRRIANTT